MGITFGEGQRKRLVNLLSELVAIPTENIPPNGWEQPGQDCLKAFYLGEGLEVDEYSPADLPEYPNHPEFLPRNLKGRNNLTATWKGSGGGKSLLLTGHMDVAPKEPMPWSVTAPYQPLVRDGRLYGRGAADMKGGLSCAAMAVSLLKESGFKPRGDILLESVVDEEYAGANGTIAARLRGHNTDFAIVLEPSCLTVCPACLGGLLFKISVRGIAGMPYTGEKIQNPAYDIADVILMIRDFAEKRASEISRPPLWQDSPQDLQIVLTKLKAGEAYESGQLSLPIDAWVEIAVQSYPGEKADDLEKGLKDYLKSRYRDPDGLLIEREYHYCRPAQSDPEHPGVALLAECAKPYTDLAKVCGAMFSCDMFALTELGRIPSAIFGPVGGRLHAPDEWVDLDSLETCVKTLADFIVRWCG